MGDLISIGAGYVLGVVSSVILGLIGYYAKKYIYLPPLTRASDSVKVIVLTPEREEKIRKAVDEEVAEQF